MVRGVNALIVVPSPEASRWSEVEDPPVELSRVAQGRVLEKHILSKGTLIHPKTGEHIKVDDAFVDALMRNFENNVADIVQVPLANDANQHVENPDANKGEVIGIRERDGKVYAIIDAREDAEKFGKTYLGASAFLSTNYKDSRTGMPAGPTLLHVAVTNRPYVVGLEPYRDIVAATADNAGDVVVMTQEESDVPPTLDELKAMLRDEHGIDVDALAATAGEHADIAALTAALQANPTLGLTADPDQISGEDIVGAVVELSRQNVMLANGYEEMRRERAADAVDALIGSGHVLPKQREFAINLKLTKPADFEEFVPDKPVIPVNQQSGVGGDRDERETTEHQQGEVARLTAEYEEFFNPEAANARRRGKRTHV